MKLMRFADDKLLALVSALTLIIKPRTQSASLILSERDESLRWGTNR